MTDARIAELTREIERKRRPGDVDLLLRIAREAGLQLPADYVEFMRGADGGEGDVGEALLRLWPVQEIAEEAQAAPRYDGVLLFAGDGANTIYGFDAHNGGEIVEGDWIGLNRDELIPHGRTFLDLLESLAAEPRDA